MADNYLENRMEEHRRQQGGGAPARRSGTMLPRGCVALDTSGATVLIVGVDANPALAEAVVKCYGSACARPAFADTDITRGRSLAQAAAARHYPMSDDAAVEAAAPDLVIHIIKGSGLDVVRGGRTVRIPVGEVLEPSLRRWLLLLLVPEVWAFAPDVIQTV